ncbi:hypothetical protein KIPE111705_36915 [Kibdelosporangium persicum]|uniref:Uncharacterized protein n=1 Tax=Kibdelosporangium persicum TaxID=2698649 RepID=A0ABX2F3J3_9PSEU|nr:hypothetical protein [Kibdelosporangium persicum]NRN65903.1 hypothetical protein [Kibdelosporangium persicum]
MNTTAALTTADVTRLMTEVATALAEYDHLPRIDRVAVYGSGMTYLSLPYSIESGSTQRLIDELTRLCAWAAAFNTTVTITLSYGGSGDAAVQVDLAGHPARLLVSLHSGQAYELGAALRRPVSSDQPTLTVAPADLLAAFTRSNGHG